MPEPLSAHELSAAIYKKLHAVRKEITAVEKKGRNDFHKYDYAKEEDFLNMLSPLLVKHGLVIDCSVSGSKKEEQLTTVQMTYFVTDIDTGYQIVRQWEGTGEDKNDKGMYKAQTGCNKYFLYKFFQIPTSDDPDDAGKKRQQQKQAAPPPDNAKLTASDVQKLIDAAQKFGLTAQKFNAMVRRKYGMSVTEISRDKAAEILTGLKKRAAEKMM